MKILLSLLCVFVLVFSVHPISIYYANNLSDVSVLFDDIKVGEPKDLVVNKIRAFAQEKQIFNQNLKPACFSNRHFRLNCKKGETAITFLAPTLFDDISIGIKFDYHEKVVKKQLLAD